MTQSSMNICGPWSIALDRNGTEDIALILDASGSFLARSRMFWRPTGNDGPSETWDSIRLMRAAPQLYQALQAVQEALHQVQPDHPACETARLAFQSVWESPEPIVGVYAGDSYHSDEETWDELVGAERELVVRQLQSSIAEQEQAEDLFNADPQPVTETEG